MKMAMIFFYLTLTCEFRSHRAGSQPKRKTRGKQKKPDNVDRAYIVEFNYLVTLVLAIDLASTGNTAMMTSRKGSSPIGSLTS